MSKRKPGYWKEYYQKHRQQRLEESKEYRRLNPRPDYSAKYYLGNKEKWKKSEAQKQERNAKRRKLYAENEATRIKARKLTREWQIKNPDKKRNQHLKKFGITIEVFNKMLQGQSGGCAICGALESPDKSTRSKSGKRRLHVDHCHSSGLVRGLLCSSCNLGLGKFFDRADLLEKAALYIRKHASSGTM
jgi:hypothetical protein